MFLKNISLLLVFLFSSSVYAVQTKYCPQDLNIEISDFKVFSKSFSYSIASSLESADYKSIDYALEGGLETIKISLALQSKENSECYYGSSFDDSEYKEALIQGTDKSPVLRIRYVLKDSDVSYKVFLKPTSTRPLYDFSGATAQVKTDGFVQEWDETFVRFIPVAKGTVK